MGFAGAGLYLAGLFGVALAAFGAVLVGAGLSDRGSGGVLTGVVLVALAGAPTIWRLRDDPLDPCGLCALMTVGMLGIVSLAWTGDPIQPGPGLDQAVVARALLIVALGLVAFGVAVRVFAKSGPRRSSTTIVGPMPSRAVLYGVFLVSVAGVGLALTLGVFGYISDPAAVSQFLSVGQVFALVQILGGLVVIVAALSYFTTGDRRYLPPLILFTTIQVASGFVGGNKQVSIQPLIFVILAYALTHRRIPAGPIAIAVVFLFVVVLPINLSYREQVRLQSVPPSLALRSALSAPLTLSPGKAVKRAIDYVTLRFRAIDSVALIYDQTPSPFQYAGGRKYALLPAIALVPRAVWPSKPLLDDAGRFTHTYGQAPNTVRTSTQLTQIGDLYRSMGFAGVVGGMLAFGAAMAAATNLYRRRHGLRADLVFIFAVPTVILYVESDLPYLLATAARSLPFAVVIAWLLLPDNAGGEPGYRTLVRDLPWTKPETRANFR